MLRGAFAVLLVAGVVTVTGSGAAAPAPPEKLLPLRTAVADDGAFGGRQAKLAFRRTRGAGATFVRLVLWWRDVAPRRPLGDRTDPESEGYVWDAFDEQVRNARARGLTPIVMLTHTPKWARDTRPGGRETTWPDPRELAYFAEAAAWRYSGYYEVPAVRIWQVWGEPNARTNLRPQFVDGDPVSPDHYRRMVNAVGRSVRRVRENNLVVAGGLSPFGHLSADIAVVAPLRFMRRLLCVDRRGNPTCRDEVAFDVWAHHPYTAGGPTRRARAQDDVSIGDLPEMRRLLDAGIESGHVRSKRDVEFWVTEFTWDTNPPDPDGVPLALHARWVAEGLYRMWHAGVSLVTWYLIRDSPLARSPYQSGLWFSNGSSLGKDRPKPALQAFRFPFVALRDRRGVLVWGRLPYGTRGRVAIERRVRRVWTRVNALRANANGIFEHRFDRRIPGPFRAYWIEGEEPSVGFYLRAPKDRHVHPFGCGGGIRCAAPIASESD